MLTPVTVTVHTPETGTTPPLSSTPKMHSRSSLNGYGVLGQSTKIVPELVSSATLFGLFPVLFWNEVVPFGAVILIVRESAPSYHMSMNTSSFPRPDSEPHDRPEPSKGGILNVCSAGRPCAAVP